MIVRIMLCWRYAICMRYLVAKMTRTCLWIALPLNPSLWIRISFLKNSCYSALSSTHFLPPFALALALTLSRVWRSCFDWNFWFYCCRYLFNDWVNTLFIFSVKLIWAVWSLLKLLAIMASLKLVWINSSRICMSSPVNWLKHLFKDLPISGSAGC